MRHIGLETASRHQAGLTMIELLLGLALTGAAFLLLLPRPLPAPSPARCPCACGSAVRTAAPAQPQAAERGFIGVQLAPAPSEDGYVRIHRPMPGRPAQRAGVRPGDVLLRVDGRSTRHRPSEEVVDWITEGRPGTAIRLTVRRAGSTETADLKVIRGSFLTVFLPGFSGRP